MKVYIIKADSYDNDKLYGSYIIGVALNKKMAEAVANEYMDNLCKIGYTFQGMAAVSDYLPKIIVNIKCCEIRL